MATFRNKVSVLTVAAFVAQTLQVNLTATISAGAYQYLDTIGSPKMFLRSVSPRNSVRLSSAAPGAAAACATSVAVCIPFGVRRTSRRRSYSSTRRVENYLPMVLESTPRGERAYDIYSRLLRVSQFPASLTALYPIVLGMHSLGDFLGFRTNSLTCYEYLVNDTCTNINSNFFMKFLISLRV